jgi:WD40 repeat protein
MALLQARRAALIAALVATVGLALAVPASATFPGANGSLVVMHYAGVGVAQRNALDLVNPRTRRRRTAQYCALLTQCQISSPRISPDGRRIAYISPNFPGRLILLTISGVEVGRIPGRFTLSPDLAWLPGARGLLVSAIQGDNAAIYRADQTKLLGRFPGLALDASELDVSNRGSVVSRTSPNDADFDDWEILTSRGRTTIISQRRVGEINDLSWSPSGKLLAAATLRGVFIVRLNGSPIRRLTKGGADLVAWSPDGRRVAYSAKRDLNVVNANGKRRRHLLRLGQRGSTPAGFDSIDWQPRPSK